MADRLSNFLRSCGWYVIEADSLPLSFWVPHIHHIVTLVPENGAESVMLGSLIKKESLGTKVDS